MAKAQWSGISTAIISTLDDQLLAVQFKRQNLHTNLKNSTKVAKKHQHSKTKFHSDLLFHTGFSQAHL